MTRDELGRLVRETWIAYCIEMGDGKPSHLTGWDDLPEYDKEVDRRIGEGIKIALIEDQKRLAMIAPPPPPDDPPAGSYEPIKILDPKLPPTWPFSLVKGLALLSIVAFFIGLVVLDAIREEQITPTAGKIVKLWIQPGGGNISPSNYAVIDGDNGRQSVLVSPDLYGQLEVGQSCTFDVGWHGYTKSAQCQNER